jgi:flagellar basal-body rod modification protein FlgD
MTTSAITPTDSIRTAGPDGKATKAYDPAAAQDSFMQLLVAQLTNQDPMNPMDNAEMTSQIAQINTVTGIQELNGTVAAISQQMSAWQSMQGTSLVGRDVMVSGNTLAQVDGTGRGAFDMPRSATNVQVQVMSAAGSVIDTVNLGNKAAGQHRFEVDLSGKQNLGSLRFNVTATDAAGQTVATTPLMLDRVDSVSQKDGALSLNLARKGTVGYGDVKAFY